MNLHMSKKPQHLGILGAMPEEVSLALNNINLLSENKFGDLTIYTGEWVSKAYPNEKLFISIAWSGWGKVSASRAATRIISLDIPNIPVVTTIIFTGVAGGLDSKTTKRQRYASAGDFVVQSCIGAQHVNSD